MLFSHGCTYGKALGCYSGPVWCLRSWREGIRVELAKRIKEHRERLGMPQGELAKAVFVTRNTISKWGTEGV